MIAELQLPASRRVPTRHWTVTMLRPLLRMYSKVCLVERMKWIPSPPIGIGVHVGYNLAGERVSSIKGLSTKPTQPVT
jgi:hypothetical protein